MCINENTLIEQSLVYTVIITLIVQSLCTIIIIIHPKGETFAAAQILAYFHKFIFTPSVANCVD